jgi:uncharacterized protein
MAPDVIDLIKKWLDSHPEILLAILYGSFARNTATATSDIDLAVAAKEPLDVEKRIVLSQELGALARRSVDLVDLKTAHGLIVDEVLSEGGLFLRKDEDAYEQLLKRHLIENAYDRPIREKILKERRNRVFKTKD